MNISILFLLSMGWINSCASKQYAQHDSVFILLKTPTFKHADLGFVYQNENELKIELYGSGYVVSKFTIENNKICMSFFECMNKDEFNAKVLSPNYPDDILEDIFRNKVIFNGLNIIKTRNGFTQHIVKGNIYNINYSFLDNKILFNDTINRIKIKIQRIDE